MITNFNIIFIILVQYLYFVFFYFLAFIFLLYLYFLVEYQTGSRSVKQFKDYIQGVHN